MLRGKRARSVLRLSRLDEGVGGFETLGVERAFSVDFFFTFG